MYMRNHFTNCVVYMVSSINPNINTIYITSTTNYSKSKQLFYNSYYSGSQNKSIFQFIRDNGSIIEWEFKVLECGISCNNRRELEEREFKWWACMTKPKPKIIIDDSIKATIKELVITQNINLKNELFYTNFQKSLEEIRSYGMLRYPLPENLLSPVIL